MAQTVLYSTDKRTVVKIDLENGDLTETILATTLPDQPQKITKIWWYIVSASGKITIKWDGVADDETLHMIQSAGQWDFIEEMTPLANNATTPDDTLTISADALDAGEYAHIIIEVRN